ncbi:MAG: RDD family protein [Gemmatimonadetes bacterium]|nr:RDD family protein [Gemmatimonadota bacterium]
MVWGYFTLFEGFRDGQTPGKKWMGLRVIRDTGHPITVREAGARNLLRIVDLLPPPYLLGILFIAFHPKGKRIGDLVAGTVVVRDRPADAPVALIEGEGDAVATGAPQLSDEDFRILREFVGRAPQPHLSCAPAWPRSWRRVSPTGTRPATPTTWPSSPPHGATNRLDGAGALPRVFPNLPQQVARRRAALRR